MTLLTFKEVDKILIELPKDINNIIYGYYNDNHCLICIKKDGCDKCEFCLEHRTKSEYYCNGHCSCSIAWSDNWKGWYQEHYGIELEPEAEAGSSIDEVMDNLSKDLLNDITLGIPSLRRRRNGISSTPPPEINTPTTIYNIMDLPPLEAGYYSEEANIEPSE